MDFRDTTVKNGQKVSLSITSALVSAVLEWLLISMLFIDACFAYVVTRFARCYKLQIPCLLCSRLDHVLGNERAGFCWDLICREHKSKISSLIFCQIHNKLADVHETCESCFFSFATVNKSNAITYRLLVGKLGAEPHDGEDGPSLSHMKKCLCCNQQWNSGTYSQKLFKTKSIDSELVTFEDNKDEELGTSILDLTQNINSDLLPHVEYKKISTTSDTESETLFSDNESGHAIIREVETSDQDSAVKHVIPEPRVTTLSSYQDSEKLIDPTPMTTSLLDSDNITNSLCTIHESELNWKQADHIDDLHLTSEPTLSSNVTNGNHKNDSEETIVEGTTHLGNEINIRLREALKPDSELCEGVTLESAETSRVGSDSNSTTEIQEVLKPNDIDNNSQTVESLDLGDAYRLAVGTRRQLSGRFLQNQKSITDSTRISEDLKLLLSQLSAARGFESSLNDISPRISTSSEDYKTMDDPSRAMQILQRRISLERNESNVSLDGSAMSEIEGESVIDRLKRQVEHDKKIMSALYKELDEERNASAIAANQAMAMITRLQEEKAALHMEALQCLRMMEEQAEYDDEALQKANQMLVEKDKRIQDLEAELELLRNHGLAKLNEMHFISQSVTDLEKKLLMFGQDEAIVGSNNGDFFVGKEIDASASDELYYKKVSQEHGDTGKHHPPREESVSKETAKEDASLHVISETENYGKF